VSDQQVADMEAEKDNRFSFHPPAPFFAVAWWLFFGQIVLAPFLKIILLGSGRIFLYGPKI
jgi:hypothetical protein